MASTAASGKSDAIGRKQRRRETRLREKQKKALARLAGTGLRAARDAVDEGARLVRRGDLESIGKGLRLLVDAGGGHPEDAAIQLAVGEACCGAANFDLAYQFLKQAVVLAPDNAHAWSLLATCLYAQKQFEAARIAIEMAIRLRPEDAGAYLVYGKILSFLEEDLSVLAVYDRAIELAPNTGTLLLALLEKGHHQQALGDIEAARADFSRALQIDPDSIKAAHALTSVRARFEDPDGAVARLESGLATQVLGIGEKAEARFAIARILASEKRHDEAFPHFMEGNRIRGEHSRYQIDATVRQFDALIEAFTADRFRALSDLAHPSERPVFIVGMPRSGTTLTEAILARHASVKAFGERPDMPRLAGLLADRNQGNPAGEGALTEGAAVLRYPQDLTEMDRGGLRILRDGFLDGLEQNAPAGALRLVDKMPFNFIHLGLIATFFPHAGIIHCVRDPMDTCLSCFTQNFTDELGFTYDLDTLGRYYRGYRRLMDHWKSVLPNPIFEASYETLVADQEGASRALIAHLGLEWQDSCLEFHRSGFQTKTASNWQVRQPIYRTAVQGWKKYESFLGPLRAALGDEAVQQG